MSTLPLLRIQYLKFLVPPPNSEHPIWCRPFLKTETQLVAVQIDLVEVRGSEFNSETHVAHEIQGTPLLSRYSSTTFLLSSRSERQRHFRDSTSRTSMSSAAAGEDTYQLSTVLRAHSDDVKCVYPIDADRLLSASRDRTVGVWRRKGASKVSTEHVLQSHPH